MADREHPKTHVEDQDLKGKRKQPLSPKHEGIDPLTEGDTMLPREDVKGDSKKVSKKEAEEPVNTEVSEQTVADQEERDAVAGTPNELLDDSKGDGSQADLEEKEVEKNGKTADSKPATTAKKK